VIFLLSILSFFLFLRLTPPALEADALSERAPGVVRVVTWNVGRGGGRYGRPLAEDDVAAVAEVLQEIDADLVFLQEIAAPDQLDRLASALGSSFSARLARGESDRLVGVLARRGTITPFQPARPDGRSLGVILRLPGSPAVAAATLHADAFSSRRRNLGIGEVATSLLARKDAAVYLLAGDLNLDLDLDKRRDLFTDDEHLDVETYNFLATRLVDVTRGTGSTAEPDRRLDYIFCSDKGVEILRRGPLRGRRPGDLDHDPVLADLRLRQD
jgi:endonuclease/exonuclease/phosphatase family metal-dependent hydrolase